ncbi:YggS family pyridoxal phosphate-dependent enzyme [Dermacoccaceae bacterium W4C1]
MNGPGPGAEAPIAATPQRVAELRAALTATRDRIAAAAHESGRDAGELTLVVVTKFFPVQDLLALAGLGVTDVGENRHQEAQAKAAQIPAEVRANLRMHFIGQLQSNKAAAVAGYADVVQSLDRAKVAAGLGRAAESAGRTLEVTAQVDLAGDDAGRGGVSPQELPRLLDTIADTRGLHLRGLMAVAPLGGDPAEAFERLAVLREQTVAQHPHATWMSAGMSGDLEQAVRSGATHLRVGSAILGSRPAQR